MLKVVLYTLRFYLKKINILKVNDIHLHQQLKWYFKLINNILPNHFHDFNLVLSSDMHDYNTGGGDKLRNAHLKHEFPRNCIRNQMSHLLNTRILLFATVVRNKKSGIASLYLA